MLQPGGGRQTAKRWCRRCKQPATIVDSCRFQRLVHDQGIDEVRLRLTICLQGAPDHFIVLKAHIGLLQKLFDDSEYVIPGCAIAAPDQCPYRHASRRQRLGRGPVRAHLVTVQGANHSGTFGVPAKRRTICRREIATVARERSPVTVASISEAARRPDWRAPCIHPRCPEACSPAK